MNLSKPQRWWMAGGIAALAITAAVALPLRQTSSALPQVVVYKSPTCGCCGAWVEHMRDNGFDVITRNVNDMTPIKTEHGIPAQLASCHTAVIDGYVVEGHVPAADVKALLQQRPQVTGLSVPGMPIGSPGMEQNGVTQPYDVVAFDKQGLRVFNSYR